MKPLAISVAMIDFASKEGLGRNAPRAAFYAGNVHISKDRCKTKLQNRDHAQLLRFRLDSNWTRPSLQSQSSACCMGGLGPYRCPLSIRSTTEE